MPELLDWNNQGYQEGKGETEVKAQLSVASKQPLSGYLMRYNDTKVQSLQRLYAFIHVDPLQTTW